MWKNLSRSRGPTSSTTYIGVKGANHRKTTNRTDTQSNIVSIPDKNKTYQHCNNQGVPPKMQVHFNKCLPPRMQGPFLVC